VPRQIFLRNSLTRKKETFEPLEAGQVKMYACGVTVYDECHIGHAMQAIYFDVIRNVFEHCGYRVTYVRNFTDVDDKIINRAQALGISPRKLVEDMIAASQRDMKALKIRSADCEPRVTEVIPEIISMIEDLIRTGNAYATDKGNVYFKVSSKKDYGKLSNRKPEELLSGTRELAGDEKVDSLDFALWKKDEVEGASWDSPWGRGRPGWHIECSAMAKKFLGTHFDIHGGGRDLIFPHHENEIAQSECANKTDFAKYWLHSGLLTIKQQKMSKSLGNTITIQNFLKDWHAEVLRFAFLQNHYASNVDFDEGVFNTCRKRLFYFYKTLAMLAKATEDQTPSKLTPEEKTLAGLSEDFDAAMCDDFNSAMALAVLNNIARLANQILNSKKGGASLAQNILTLMQQKGRILGLFQESPQDFIDLHKARILRDLNLSEEVLESLIQKRKQARDQKDWTESDRIRTELTEKGISLHDTSDGTSWSISVA
jgi:cysteinyl-tRNA synthetase